MPTLGGLLAEVDSAKAGGLPVRVVGDANADIRGITHESGRVREGSLFCCVRGEKHDGHRFAADAVRHGATALVVEHELSDLAVPQIVSADVRETMGHLSAAFFGHPSHRLTVVGITGTNGKTTTAHMLGAMLQRSGKPTTVLGTLTGVRTTPEAPELQQSLADECDKGTGAVVMEVSSHALTLKRVAGMRFSAAVFTNLGHDHLDFHGTHEAYFAAKASLFTHGYATRAIVNRDDAFGLRIIEQLSEKVELIAYGIRDADDVQFHADGSHFSWRGTRLRCPIGGAFNVMNALAAATTAAELGVAIVDIATALNELPQIPGRFENVNIGGEFAVLVDYAHTPEALTNVINAVRASLATTTGNTGHATRSVGRITVVFGCGGDRDSSKRADMGAAACAADHVVITSDNPRSEDPASIIEAIVEGVPSADRAKVTVEVDRRRAIELACSHAEPGDVIVIAGRGHETTQSIGGSEVPFSDAEVARTVLAGRS